jgi:hypothetical protein
MFYDEVRPILFQLHPAPATLFAGQGLVGKLEYDVVV